MNPGMPQNVTKMQFLGHLVVAMVTNEGHSNDIIFFIDGIIIDHSPIKFYGCIFCLTCKNMVKSRVAKQLIMAKVLVPYSMYNL